MIYIQDDRIPAKGLRRRLWCVLKKLLKSPQKDLLADLVARRGSPVVFTGVPGAAKGWRRRLWCSWKKLLMEFILALDFGLCFFDDFASENKVFIAPWGTRIK